LGIKGNRVFVINLDACSSCVNTYQSSVLNFLKEEHGKVLILSSSKKKANFFVNLEDPNVFWDRPFELMENSFYEEAPLVFILEGEKYQAKSVTNSKIIIE
jgi:hypothetical protein